MTRFPRRRAAVIVLARCRHGQLITSGSPCLLPATRPPMTGKPKIRVTRKLPDEVETRLRDHYTALLNSNDRVLTPSELLAGASDCDGLLVTPGDKFPAHVIAQLPASIRIIASFSVGHDHIDVAAARAKGVAVTNTPDVLTDATADIAMLLILGAARGASWGDRMVREGRWKSVSRRPLRSATTSAAAGSASSAWAASAAPWRSEPTGSTCPLAITTATGSIPGSREEQGTSPLSTTCCPNAISCRCAAPPRH